MAQRTWGRNPYAAPPENTTGAAPGATSAYRLTGSTRYAVPNIPESTQEGANDGFSPELVSGGSPVATPDDIRIGRREPTLVDPNYHEYSDRRDADYRRRHVDEQQPGLLQSESQRAIPPPRVPLWEQDRPSRRPLATKMPVTGSTIRPWHIPRNRAEIDDNGVLHASLAAHRRDYPIMRMEPQGGTGVNSYRATPRPWDANLTVPRPAEPANAQPSFGGGSRSYRLG